MTLNHLKLEKVHLKMTHPLENDTPPWLPEQIPGFGPWIEGPVPENFRDTEAVGRVVLASERRVRLTVNTSVQLRGFIDALFADEIVAYCVSDEWDDTKPDFEFEAQPWCNAIFHGAPGDDTVKPVAALRREANGDSGPTIGVPVRITPRGLRRLKETGVLILHFRGNSFPPVSLTVANAE